MTAKPSTLSGRGLTVGSRLGGVGNREERGVQRGLGEGPGDRDLPTVALHGDRVLDLGLSLRAVGDRVLGLGVGLVVGVDHGGTESATLTGLDDLVLLSPLANDGGLHGGLGGALRHDCLSFLVW